MNNVPEKYKKLIRNLTEACKILSWEFSTETDLVDRWCIEDGVAFTIDKVEYFVSRLDLPNTTEAFYYAGIMIQNHGHREEPPSEDEQELKGNPVDERNIHHLLKRIIDTHYDVRCAWIAEHLAYLDEPEHES